MVELRKRSGAASDAPQPPLKKSSSTAKFKAQSEPKEAPSPLGDGTEKGKMFATGDVVDLDGFGGEVETQDGQQTNLKQLVSDSKNGVVLFTYPKASTPGCTTQACLFRDEFTPLTATGYSIYGLSSDSPKSNTTFKNKQKLPYALLCDHNATLIAAIGMKKVPKGTIRGIFVIGKDCKVEAAEPGGPAATVDVVRKLVQAAVASLKNVGSVAETGGTQESVGTDETDLKTNDPAEKPTAIRHAEVAAEVADSAERLDADASTEEV